MLGHCQHLARVPPALVKQLFWVVCVRLVEPAVHEGGKVVELLRLEEVSMAWYETHCSRPT